MSRNHRRTLLPLPTSGERSQARARGDVAALLEQTEGSSPRVNSSRNAAHPQCRISHSGVQAVPTGAWTALSMDTTVFDYAGGQAQHSAITNNPRLTCVVPGLYLVTGGCRLVAGAAGARYAGIFRGGSTAAIDGNYSGTGNDGSGAEIVLNDSTLLRFAVGDWIALYAFQGTGGNLNAELQSLAWTFISP